MLTETNELGGRAQKPPAIFAGKVPAKNKVRRGMSGVPPQREREAIDQNFQALLAEANREFANLLRDLNTAPHRAVSGRGQNQPLSELLVRAIRCAAKQYMVQAELGNLALTDELTGFYNRRGFHALGERQLKLARRSGRSILLFFVDVDGLKRINDSFGHAEGDVALARTAEALENSFRDSDLMARLGGDEFAVLAVEAPAYSEATIRERVGEYLKQLNSRESRYAISLSLGVVRFDPETHMSIKELTMEADRAMYREKRTRLGSSYPSGEG